MKPGESIRRRRVTLQRILVTSLLLLLGLVVLLLPPVSTSGTLSSLVIWCLLAALIIASLWSIHRFVSVDSRTIEDELQRMQAQIDAIGSRTGDQFIDSEAYDHLDLRRLADRINDLKRRHREDITGMKRLEQVRTEFLGNVSHELRTPIFSVQGYLETLLDGAIDEPEVREEFLEKAHSNTLRLHSLLTDLIEISRIESGEMRMSFRYFDLDALIDEVVTSLSSTAESAGVTLKVAIEGQVREGISVYGDRKRIEQALVNLVSNAIKYNRQGGTVTISCGYAEADRIRIEVRDTGIGIEPEHLDRIFERFYRVDKARSREIGGSGLGLAIVKHIVEAHGSRISVTSRPGHGTTFAFELKHGE